MERIEDSRGQRRHLVWITPAGEALLREEFEVLSAELLGDAMARMKATDRSALVRGMRALLGAARDAAREKREKPRER